MPTEVVQQVYSGRLKPDVLTLAMTLDQYEAYKSDTPKAAREIGQRVERLRTDMKSVFGKQKLKYTPLTDITRQDANDLRDHLLSRVSANSAVRMLGVVRTAINHVIVEHSLTIPNVFTNLKIKGAGATKHDRLPKTALCVDICYSLKSKCLRTGSSIFHVPLKLASTTKASPARTITDVPPSGVITMRPEIMCTNS